VFEWSERSRQTALPAAGFESRSGARVCQKGKMSAARQGREIFPSEKIFLTKSRRSRNN